MLLRVVASLNGLLDGGKPLPRLPGLRECFREYAKEGRSIDRVSDAGKFPKSGTEKLESFRSIDTLEMQYSLIAASPLIPSDDTMLPRKVEQPSYILSRGLQVSYPEGNRACGLHQRIADGKRVFGRFSVLDSSLRRAYCLIGKALQPQDASEVRTCRGSRVKYETDVA